MTRKIANGEKREKRRAFLFRSSGYLVIWSSLLFLAACGFRPLYAKHHEDNPDSKVYGGVSVDPVSGDKRMGQQFRANLEDHLNPDGAVPAHPLYRLTVSLGESVSAIGVARDGTVSRYNVYLSSQYTLYRIADNKPIASGGVSHVSSYNNLVNDYFSTYISEDDAIRRGVEELSEIYRTRLGAYLDAGASEQKDAKPLPEGQPVPPPSNPWQIIPGQPTPNASTLPSSYR